MRRMFAAFVISAMLRPPAALAQAAAEYAALGAQGASGSSGNLSSAITWLTNASPFEWALIGGGLLVAALLLDRLFDAM